MILKVSTRFREYGTTAVLQGNSQVNGTIGQTVACGKTCRITCDPYDHICRDVTCWFDLLGEYASILNTPGRQPS